MTGDDAEGAMERERDVWVRGRDCSSLITLQWLSFGYQFPWWSVYFLPPWGLRLSEIFLGYIFNVSQLNNAISLLSIVSGASPSSNLCLVCKEIIFRRLKDHDLTVEPWNCVPLRGLYIFPSLSITGGRKPFFIPRSSINEGSNPQWSIELALRHSARVIIYSIFKV